MLVRTSYLEPSNLEGRFVVNFFELVFDLELVVKIVEITSLKYAWSSKILSLEIKFQKRFLVIVTLKSITGMRRGQNTLSTAIVVHLKLFQIG